MYCPNTTEFTLKLTYMETIKSLIYSLLDLLSFGKGLTRNISGFNIQFPARWSRYFESNYEAENIAFLKEHVKPGQVVLDIGAHLGLMTVISSQLSAPGGKVYAFEPSPSTFGLLQQVLALNSGYANVVPVHMAISNTSGSIRFYLSSDLGSNSNSLVEKHHLKREAIDVNCTTIDAFAKKEAIALIHLLKIDAEGSELQVLQGAKEVLQNHRPKVILAIHPRLIRNNANEPKELFELITSLKYTIIYKKNALNKEAFCAIDDFFDVHLLPLTT